MVGPPRRSVVVNDEEAHVPSAVVREVSGLFSTAIFRPIIRGGASGVLLSWRVACDQYCRSASEFRTRRS
jgi:hypothetical protein